MKNTIDNKDLENLLVAAFEGGINHWCNALMFETKKSGKELMVYERILSDEEVILFSSRGVEKWLLSKEKVLNAIPKTISHYSFASFEEMMKKLNSEVGNSLIQFALFNKIAFE